jgi:hypothetical protein
MPEKLANKQDYREVSNIKEASKAIIAIVGTQATTGTPVVTSMPEK